MYDVPTPGTMEQWKEEKKAVNIGERNKKSTVIKHFYLTP